MKFLKGLVINLQFFTSIPIPLSIPMDKEHLEKAIKAFPFLGLIQGAIYAFLLYAVIEWTPFSVLTAAIVIWLAGILVTGGIHLDGWMDSCDAYFSYRDKAKRLEIMADPRIGAFGVLSVIVLLTVKFFFIYEIMLHFSTFTYLLVLLMPFFSRMGMGVLLIKGKSAKKDGLGTMFKDASNKYTLLYYPLYILIFTAIIAFFYNEALVSYLMMVLVSVLITGILLKKTVQWFGGVTGDVIGASVEGMELFLWMTLWLLHYFVMG